jgi:small subunit ribosomal protein S21e
MESTFEGGLQDDSGKVVDMYIPRKCSWTNRLLRAKDHASVQVNIGKVNEGGMYVSSYDTFALSGFVRSKGEGDLALTELARVAGHLDFSYVNA